MKHVILTVLIGLLLLPAVLNAAVSAYAFGDYYMVLDHHAVDAKTGAKPYEDQNGFWLRRIYLTYDSDLSDKLKARARLEMGSDGKFGSSALNLTPFVKDAYISYQFLPLHSVTLGIQESLTWANIEKFYGYRHLEKTAFDLYKVRSSRDFGVALKGSFDAKKVFNYAVMFGNNSSYRQETDKYKEIAARLTLNPNAHLMVEGGIDFVKISAVRKSSLWQLFAGYQGDWGRVGANYGRETISETGKADVHFGVFSAFAVGKFSKKIEGIVRYDAALDPQPNGQGDYLIIDKGFKTGFFTAGLGWNLHPKFQILPNIKIVNYKENSAGVKPDRDTYFNVTFYYQF